MRGSHAEYIAYHQEREAKTYNSESTHKIRLYCAYCIISVIKYNPTTDRHMSVHNTNTHTSEEEGGGRQNKQNN
jgi:hypothetical protein